MKKMIKISDFKIGKEVRWFFQIDKWSKPTDEIVYIGSEIIDKSRVRIDRKNKDGDMVEGGYVMIDELYECNK